MVEALTILRTRPGRAGRARTAEIQVVSFVEGRMAVWTVKNRRRYDRSRPDNEEWGRVEPLIPGAKTGGNKRQVNVREVVNGIMYILSTGCQ